MKNLVPFCFLFLLAILGAHSLQAAQPEQPPETLEISRPNLTYHRPCRGPGLEVSPVDPAYIHYIDPLGNLNPTGHHVFPSNHIYFYLSAPAGTSPVALTFTSPTGNVHATQGVSVVAPGNLELTAIGNHAVTLGDNTVIPQYQVHFLGCDGETKFFFDHLVGLNPDLTLALAAHGADWIPVTPPDPGTVHPNSPFQEVLAADYAVTAGQLIGYAGLKPTDTSDPQYTDFYNNMDALDFGAVGTFEGQSFEKPTDYSVSSDEASLAGAPFGIPGPILERFIPYSPKAACPLEYYPSPQKEQLEGFLGNLSPTPTPGTECGEVGEDVPFTAQGNWFGPGAPPQTLFNEDGNVALVHDNVYFTEPVISVGLSVPFPVDPSTSSSLAGNVYTFTPQTTGNINREFKDLLPGVLYYYKDLRYPMGGSSPPRFFLIVRFQRSPRTGEATLNIEARPGAFPPASRKELFFGRNMLTFSR